MANNDANNYAFRSMLSRNPSMNELNEYSRKLDNEEISEFELDAHLLQSAESSALHEVPHWLQEKPLMGKSVLIAGGSSGLGFSAAVIMASAGELSPHVPERGHTLICTSQVHV